MLVAHIARSVCHSGAVFLVCGTCHLLACLLPASHATVHADSFVVKLSGVPAVELNVHADLTVNQVWHRAHGVIMAHHPARVWRRTTAPSTTMLLVVHVATTPRTPTGP